MTDEAAATGTREWPRHGVSFSEAVRTWAYVACLSFGGPAAQIAVMHRVIVDEKRWIGEQRFLHALNFCMLLPGPEATQLATYIGWLMHRTKGALVAGLIFILPGFITIMALSMIYAIYRRSFVVDAIFFGIRPAVLAIVLQAVFRIGSRALPNRPMVVVAALSFIAIFFLRVPFPAIIGGAILLGLLGAGKWPDAFKSGKGHRASESTAGGPPLLADDAILPVSRSPFRAARVLALWLVIWLTPLFIAGWVFGTRSTLYETGLFFSKAAVVTFGGAYAVLGYVTQHGPEAGWLLPGEMLDGLGMAETTPGPLIMVLQFVGFLACYRRPPGMYGGDSMFELDPIWSGILGGTLATWVTFAPCFMWILLGAPYMEQLRHNKRLSAALTCVTAAVVGVVLSLAVTFAVHTLFDDLHPMKEIGILSIPAPDPVTFNGGGALLSLFALYLVFRRKWGIFGVIAACALAGVAVYFVQWVLNFNAD